MDKERKPHKHTEAATSSPLLSIRGLSAAYDGRTVLHDVDLEVYEHDFLGIIGPNGGGKTTLIKCILGLLRPAGGEIIEYSRTAHDGLSPAVQLDRPLLPHLGSRGSPLGTQLQEVADRPFR